MSFKLGNRATLDPKTCYEMWGKQRISIYRIPKLLAEQGIVNSKGGYFTAQGVWKSACSYIIDNPEIAKADMVSIFQQKGLVLSDEEFGEYIINKARQFSRKKYHEFLFKHPEYQQYA